MSYNPVTDFLALVRQADGVELARMPGLDYVLSAMSRAGLFSLSVGQTAPSTNQATTVWLKPALPSWTAEGTVYLWDELSSNYETATPTLWASLLSGTTNVFQSAGNASNIVGARTSLLAIERVSPVNTVLNLPTIVSRLARPLQIVDWSTAIVNHVITIVPSGGATIMRQASWALLSTPDQIAGLTLHPSSDLNGWVITP